MALASDYPTDRGAAGRCRVPVEQSSSKTPLRGEVSEKHAASHFRVQQTKKNITLRLYEAPTESEPWCEADHSPTSYAQAKNEWIYTSILPIRLHDTHT